MIADNKNTKNMNYVEIYYFNVISFIIVGYIDFTFKSTSGQFFFVLSANWTNADSPIFILCFCDSLK